MLIRFGFEIDIECTTQVPMLLALSTHSQLEGRLISQDFVRGPFEGAGRSYLDRFGNCITRIVAPYGSTRLWSDCVIDFVGAIDKQPRSVEQHAIADLPDDKLTYLVASRYCDSDNLKIQAWSLFGHCAEGGERVEAIVRFVHQHVTSGYQLGRATKTASEVFREKTVVCRDFAHLSIALCRAMNIPARYASGYLCDIGVPYSGPADYCAWFEVYLGGQWHIFDARYSTPRAGRILMVRGADAADVAMVTSFGAYQLTYFRVWTEMLEGGLDDAVVRDMLRNRPTGDALVFPSSARLA